MKRWGENSAVQKHRPEPVVLFTISGSGAVPANPDVYFYVPIPDSRLRVKVSLLFVAPAGDTDPLDITTGANLWLFESEEERSGVTGRSLPCTNLAGSTAAAPLAIPAAAPLLGYSREFVSAADAIEGRIRMLANITTGSWILQTRYQPQSVRFTDEEWNEIVGQCQPQLKSAPFTVL